MTKQDFIKKFPDVKVQQFETDTVLSKQEIKEMVKQFTNSLDMGLIYYEQCGCNVTVFTSDKMKSELNKMKPGYQVTEERRKEFCHIQRIWKDASGSGKHILQTG